MPSKALLAGAGNLIRKMILATLAFYLCLVSSLVAQETDLSTNTEYLLGSGDKLRITFFGAHQEDLSGDYDVDGAGMVSLPLVGNIRFGGMAVAEAETAIIKAYKPRYLKNPRVNIQVLNYRPFYIMGQVGSPGSYPFVNGITVLEAVVIAGGFTKRAKENQMTIIRGTDPSRTKQDATPETIVLPGDVIEVSQRYF
ncbi:MAG TPA: polysaccharide biosynthesis/export family protein [Rhodothermia bacterium]